MMWYAPTDTSQCIGCQTPFLKFERRVPARWVQRVAHPCCGEITDWERLMIVRGRPV